MRNETFRRLPEQPTEFALRDEDAATASRMFAAGDSARLQRLLPSGGSRRGGVPSAIGAPRWKS
jgi:hypothetical protein